jgi:hypothetical protein
MVRSPAAASKLLPRPAEARLGRGTEENDLWCVLEEGGREKDEEGAMVLLDRGPMTVDVVKVEFTVCC